MRSRPLLTCLLAACSVFEKTYTYVKRFSYPNATAETVQSIRECVRFASPALARVRAASPCTRAVALRCAASHAHAACCALRSCCRVLAQRGLHEFEVCALGNLAPSNAEEAKALAPSLDLPIDLQLIPEARVACRARERCAQTLTCAFAACVRCRRDTQRKQELTDEEIDAMLNDMNTYRNA